MIRHMLVVGILGIFVPSFSLASDDLEATVYRCESPTGVDLYTNKKQPGCQVVSLPAVTIAPNLPSISSSHKAMPYGLRQFPFDWFDYDGSVGSLRNQLTQGGLYGMQDWLDYNAPVGSMRNSPAYWPSPYLLYGW